MIGVGVTSPIASAGAASERGDILWHLGGRASDLDRRMLEHISRREFQPSSASAG